MIENIIFLTHDNKLGSDKLRAHDIIKKLINYNLKYKINLIHQKQKKLFDILNLYKNTIFIWVRTIDKSLINKLSNKEKNLIHIYDIVDNYTFIKNEIDDIIINNIVNGIIVNNTFMKNKFKNILNYTGRIFIIYHHWDQDCNNINIKNIDNINFGYMGSIKSLKHSDNFLYFNVLSKEFNIKFIDTENWYEYTDNVKYTNNINEIKFDNNINNNRFLNFNCHISIRKENTELFLYKTTAKIATASYFNHNIITTYEESVKDIIPDDYPFILKNTEINTIKEMFKLIIDDYNKEKKLWNKGLEIMKNVKNKLDLNNIINEYINMFKTFDI